MFFFAGALVIRAVTGFFDSRLAILHLYTSFWASLYIWIVPGWSLKIEGREKIDSKKSCIIISNHQSQLDILAAFGLFSHFKWVSKAEVFRIPSIRWNMRLNRYVEISRGRKDSIEKMMAECERHLLNGSPVFFFPEGTRSDSGEMKKFKPGAFLPAKKTGLPILLAAISGTRDALPKHSLKIQGNRVMRVTVLGEIPPEKHSAMQPEETAEMARNIISSFLEKNRVNA